VVAEALSDVFTVFPAKQFPGMMKSTELTKTIALQGIYIPKRQETRHRLAVGGKRGNTAGGRMRKT